MIHCCIKIIHNINKAIYDFFIYGEEGYTKIFIRKLRDFSPPKWGASHTEERNLFKGLPKHLIGRKETKAALEELYRNGFISKHKKTYEMHVSLNINKKKEIEKFLES